MIQTFLSFTSVISLLTQTAPSLKVLFPRKKFRVQNKHVTCSGLPQIQNKTANCIWPVTPTYTFVYLDEHLPNKAGILLGVETQRSRQSHCCSETPLLFWNLRIITVLTVICHQTQTAALRPMHCDHLWFVVCPCLSSNNSWLIHQSRLAIATWDT
jgi:hypothetical protein